MKIAFDSQLFLKGNKTGIAWCADNVIKEIAKLSEYECECDFFSLGHSKNQIDNVRRYEKLGVKLNSCRWFNNVIYKLIWPIIPIPYSWFFGKDRDVTIFFNFIPKFVYRFLAFIYKIIIIKAFLFYRKNTFRSSLIQINFITVYSIIVKQIQ